MQTKALQAPPGWAQSTTQGSLKSTPISATYPNRCIIVINLHAIVEKWESLVKQQRYWELIGLIVAPLVRKCCMSHHVLLGWYNHMSWSQIFRLQLPPFGARWSRSESHLIKPCATIPRRKCSCQLTLFSCKHFSRALGMRPKFQAQERVMLAAHVASSTATLWQWKQTTTEPPWFLTLNRSTAESMAQRSLANRMHILWRPPGSTWQR